MKQKRIMALISGLLAITGVIWGFSLLNAETVQTGTVAQGTIQDYIKLLGKIELDRTEKVFCKYNGIILDLKVKEGDLVEKNAVLAQLEATDRDVALAELEQAGIAINSARKDYQIRQDRFEKARQLFQNGAISEQEFKDFELQAVNAESTLHEAEQRYKIIEYNSFQAKLSSTGKTGNRAIIYSNMAGIVLTKYVEKGAVVQPGTLLYELGNSDTAYVRVDVLVDDMAKVKLGQSAIISGDILDDQKIIGTVFYIAPKGESKISSLGVEQQRVEVRINYDRTAIKLKPGYNVEVDLITEAKNTALYVPDKAIFEMNGYDGVFVVQDGKLKLRKINKGIENDDYIEVTDGLSVGEIIVIDPANNLKPGMKVKSN